MTPPSPPELSGSDSDPPAVIMQQSAILVEAWLRECDLTMAHGDSRETDSMVSLLGGGIVTRPKVDVPIWRRLSIKSIAKPTFSRSRNTTKVANTPDFVYEKPSQKAQLESDILEELNENREKASKGQIMSRLRNLLNRRKEQKTDEIIEAEENINVVISEYKNFLKKQRILKNIIKDLNYKIDVDFNEE